MPSGKVHHYTTIALSGAALSYLYGWTNIPLTDVAEFTLGVVSGLLLTPDLDEAEKPNTQIYSVQTIRNPLVATLWEAYWYPYGRTTNHRGHLSHGPLIGTAGRLFYLTAPVSLVVGIKVVALWFWAHPYLVAGLVASDLLHLALDLLASGVKRLYK